MKSTNSRNRFDKKDSLEIGEHAEHVFILLAVKLGWKISASSKDENIDDHWDYLIEKEDTNFKVEVKSAKRIDRHDSNAQVNYIWVELQNVRGKVLSNGWTCWHWSIKKLILSQKYAIQKMRFIKFTGAMDARTN